MTKTFFYLKVLFFIAIYNTANAQNYYVGVPVYDTVQTLTTNSMNSINCPYGEASITSSLITNMPTGVNLYFKILSSQLSTGCLNITGLGIMNVGDSSLITTTNSQFEWSSLNGYGNMTYGIFAVGTPTIVGDSFFCSSQWTFSIAYLADGCAGYWETDYYHTGSQTNCTVDSAIATSTSNFYESGISIYPNPFSITATIVLQKEVKSAIFEMFDVLGQKVKQQQLTNSKTEISRDNLAIGVYIYQIISGGKTLERGKIIIQ